MPSLLVLLSSSAGLSGFLSYKMLDLWNFAVYDHCYANDYLYVSIISVMLVALFACRTQATLAGAVTMLKCLPEKLNPVIKPLMESIKKEENERLQVCFEDFRVWWSDA